MSLLVPILLPWLGAALIALCGKLPRTRDFIGSINTLALLGVVVALAAERGWAFGQPEVLFALDESLSFALHTEPLGLLFALVSSSLWVVTHLYCLGYMRANKEERLTSFYAYFALAIGATMGVALSANLLTLFVFYELLTLSTYFLVAHKRTDKAYAGARSYLLILLFTSVAFLFPAIALTHALFGTTDFHPGGLMRYNLMAYGQWWLPLLLALFVYGIGKAALMPAHRWLPSAMVAPTPVSALLHAVAVVKAGVFTVCKLVVYIFGIDFLQRTGASEWLAYVACASILIASVIALGQDNLKARLAYSTVSQLAYVVFACALATPLAIVAAMLQILVHAWAKITLFFAAGNIHTAHHYTELSQCDGLARAMPWTYGAWLLGSLSIIGFPLFGGMWMKLNLFNAIAESGSFIWYLALIASTLLAIGYLLPVFTRGFVRESTAPRKRKEAPWQCVLAIAITATGSVALFFLAPLVSTRLASVFAAAP